MRGSDSPRDNRKATRAAYTRPNNGPSHAGHPMRFAALERSRCPALFVRRGTSRECDRHPDRECIPARYKGESFRGSRTRNQGRPPVGASSRPLPAKRELPQVVSMKIALGGQPSELKKRNSHFQVYRRFNLPNRENRRNPQLETRRPRSSRNRIGPAGWRACAIVRDSANLLQPLTDSGARFDHSLRSLISPQVASL